jgi:hypothetical protein
MRRHLYSVPLKEMRRDDFSSSGYTRAIAICAAGCVIGAGLMALALMVIN